MVRPELHRQAYGLPSPLKEEALQNRLLFRGDALPEKLVGGDAHIAPFPSL